MAVYLSGVQQGRTWIHRWITTTLALAACTFVPWLCMAFERDDVEESESPLMLAIARQLTL